MKREYYRKYEPTPSASLKPPPEKHHHDKLPYVNYQSEKPMHNSLFDNFQKFNMDDILIIALIVALATEEEPDLVTLFALAFILLS